MNFLNRQVKDALDSLDSSCMSVEKYIAKEENSSENTRNHG